MYNIRNRKVKKIIILFLLGRGYFEASLEAEVLLEELVGAEGHGGQGH
jgi:hypothetical protein